MKFPDMISTVHLDEDVAFAGMGAALVVPPGPLLGDLHLADGERVLGQVKLLPAPGILLHAVAEAKAGLRLRIKCPVWRDGTAAPEELEARVLALRSTPDGGVVIHFLSVAADRKEE